VDLQLPSLGTVDNVQPFVMLWAGSFREARTIWFKCRSSGGEVAVDWFRLLAYQAGTLKRPSLR
jgi:hypothetical protein